MDMHPTDYEQYIKITGREPTAEVTEAYTKLVNVRHMFKNGPIGFDMLINMVARLGIKFRSAPGKKELHSVADWDLLPTDGSILVEVRMNGDWLPAKYRGKIASGTLGVEMMDEPGRIVELARATKDLVRVVQQGTFARENEAKKDITAAAAEFDESQYIADIEEDPTEDFVDPDPQLVDIDLDSTDWNSVSQGDAVYIENEDGSFAEGKFAAVTTVKMDVKGETREFVKVLATPHGDSGPGEYFEEQVTLADLSAVAGHE
jgi:hypothetical protein